MRGYNDKKAFGQLRFPPLLLLQKTRCLDLGFLIDRHRMLFCKYFFRLGFKLSSKDKQAFVWHLPYLLLHLLPLPQCQEKWYRYWLIAIACLIWENQITNSFVWSLQQCCILFLSFWGLAWKSWMPMMNSGPYMTSVQWGSAKRCSTKSDSSFHCWGCWLCDHKAYFQILKIS